jgi:tetratricopeptide (TPR) repeat protein
MPRKTFTGACLLIAAAMGAASLRSRAAGAAEPNFTAAVPPPAWKVLVDQAQQARQAGRLDEAAKLFTRARSADPNNVIPARGTCEVALAAKVSSREPCHRALLISFSAQEMRNEVASLLASSEHPSLDDLVLSGVLVDAALHEAPAEPWGYLARCDIARRLGSAEVMEACLSDLRRVAPNHWATQQAIAAANEPGGGWRWSIRGLFLLVMLGTVAHARRRARGVTRLAKGASGKAAVVFVLAVCASLAAAVGDASFAAAAPEIPDDIVKRGGFSKFTIDDANPEASLPSPDELVKAPLELGYLIQELGGRAASAAKRKDHAAAARYYKALAKVSPGAPFAPRKLCEELEAAGDIPTAIAACRTVITLDGATSDDFVRFVHVSLAKEGKPSPMEQKELEAVIAHLAGNANVGTIPATLRCEVALRVEDTKALESCTAELSKLAQNDPRTISYQWALAVQKHDQPVALGLIDRARQAGVSSAGLEIMQKETRKMKRQKLSRGVILVVGAAVLGVALMLGLRRLALRRRLSA